MISTDQKIKLLHENLRTLRILAGWSADELARMLNVSRQTIVNLENNHSSGMTTVQYLAIRSLFEAVICSNKNYILAKAIEILVDSDDKDYSNDFKENIRNIVKEKAESVGRRAGSLVAGSAASAVLGTVFTGASFVPFDPVLGLMSFAFDFLKGKR